VQSARRAAAQAHQMLLRPDPLTVTVTSVACQWGFTNLGRFAAAYAARYRETPTETLRRGSFRRSATKLPGRARTVRR